jgi:phosphatidate cytidylyltransferase
MINKELQTRIISSIILLPLALYFIVTGSFYLIFFTIICFLVSIYEWNKMVKKIEIKLLGTLFLIFSFYAFYEISIVYLWIFVLLVCISTDIGGYIFGKLFKGPKLTKISPNKTYSGMIGGYLLSLIFLSFFMVWMNHTVNVEWFLVTILISTVSQIGDIIISYFKRLSKVKDTGKIIPGHGGLLDRIDGMIFAFPTFYLVKLSGYLT